MNLDQRKRKIKSKYFSNGAVAIITILGSIGAALIYFPLKNISNNYSSGFIALVIVGIFFTLLSLYCWLLYFLNIILKPHKEVLYLKKDKHIDIYFVDRKGKKYNYDFGYGTLEEGYYIVLKTHDYIYDVLEKTNDGWPIKEKNKYFSNLYTTMGNYENVLLLPIIYLALVIGIILFIKGNVPEKLPSILIIVGSSYVIIYDLIYKIKLKKSGTSEIDNTDLIKFSSVMQKVTSVIPAIVICIIFSIVYIKLNEFIFRIIFLPFLCCGYCTLGYYLTVAFQNQKFKNLFLKMYLVIFLIYWFGVLIIATISSIVQKQSEMIIFSVPFWLVGIYVAYKSFIKK